MIALVVMSDGRREYLEQTIASFDAMAEPRSLVTRRIIHNDCPDPDFARWLTATYPDYEHVQSWQSLIGNRSGFGGAIRSIWSHLRAFPKTERFLFWLEEDFTFTRTIPLAAMVDVLDLCPHLAQLCLRRQPWNDVERAAGGVVESHPDAYAEVEHVLASGRQVAWLEQRIFWSTNPSLFRLSLLADYDWPDVDHSEGAFTHQLLEDPELRFGYWGSWASGEWCTHIGDVRTGLGY